MKITWRRASRDDVARQFRYYLVKLDLPEIAVRFKEAIKTTAKTIREQPRAAPPCRLRNPQLQNLRSWPVVGFDAIRFYFLVDDDAIRVIRILHGKRDVSKILGQETLERKTAFVVRNRNAAHIGTEILPVASRNAASSKGAFEMKAH